MYFFFHCVVLVELALQITPNTLITSGHMSVLNLVYATFPSLEWFHVCERCASAMKQASHVCCHLPAGSLLDGLCTPPPAPIGTFFSSTFFASSFSAVFLLCLEPVGEQHSLVNTQHLRRICMSYLEDDTQLNPSVLAKT